MKSRLVASLALSALIVTGATGCTFITNQATTMEYSPSDGVNVSDAGPVLVRNALIVVDETGETGNLVGAFINDSKEPQTVTLDLGPAGQVSARLDGNATMSLGAGDEPLRLEGIDALAGSMYTVFVQSGESEGTQVQVPVIDGTLPYYTDLVPSELPAEPTPEPTATTGS